MLRDQVETVLDVPSLAKVKGESETEQETPRLGQEQFRALGPSRADLLRVSPSLFHSPDFELTTVRKTKIAALEDEIRLAKTLLQADLRLARNFTVLTPFRASTRDRIQLALQPLEKRVRHARMK